MKRSLRYAKRCRLALALLTVAALALSLLIERPTKSAAAATQRLVKIALEGETIPGSTTLKYNFFDEPQVNNLDDVVFEAAYSNLPPGSLNPVRKTNTIRKGSTSGAKPHFDHVVKAGKLTPAPTAPPPPVLGYGFFLKRKDQPVVTLAKVGDPSPTGGTLGGTSCSIDGPAFNNKATAAFVFDITGAPGTPPPTQALFMKRVGHPLEVIAKEGDPAPPDTFGVFGGTFYGCPTGGAVRVFDDIALTDDDDVIFIASYTKNGGMTFEVGMFLKEDDGKIRTIVKTGDQLPVRDGTTVQFAGTFIFDLDGPWVNNPKGPADKDGPFYIAFKADVRDPNNNNGTQEGLWIRRSDQGPIKPFILPNDPGPEEVGGVFGSGNPNPPATRASLNIGRGKGINNSNTVGLLAGIDGGYTINGTQVKEAVITKPLGGCPVDCVFNGQNAPGTESNTSTFVNFHDTDGEISDPGINNQGTVAFTAHVNGFGMDSMMKPILKQGIWTCQAEILKLIVLEGLDTIPGTGSTFCTPEEVALNDSGHVVFLNERLGAAMTFGCNSPRAVVLALGPRPQ